MIVTIGQSGLNISSSIMANNRGRYGVGQVQDPVTFYIKQYRKMLASYQARALGAAVSCPLKDFL